MVMTYMKFCLDTGDTSRENFIGLTSQGVLDPKDLNETQAVGIENILPSSYWDVPIARNRKYHAPNLSF